MPDMASKSVRLPRVSNLLLRKSLFVEPVCVSLSLCVVFVGVVIVVVGLLLFLSLFLFLFSNNIFNRDLCCS